MAKNFRGWGDAVYVTAPFAVKSGDPLAVGNIFGFCGADAAAGTTVALWVRGEYEVTKVSAQAWAEGQLVYWDGSARKFDTTNTSGNVRAGVAVKIAANPSTLGTIRLSGHF